MVSAAALAAASAQAGLIVNPGLSSLFVNGDDETTHLTLDDTFWLFGQPFTGIDVSINGNLNFAANYSYSNTPLPNSGLGGMIAPLWDDFTMLYGSQVNKQSGDGWVAITWKHVGTWWDPDERHSFQVVMFSEDRKLGGFDFKMGDFAFAYGPMGDRLNWDDAATVGLQSFDGLKSVGLPDGDTVIGSMDIAKLHPVKTEFVLYRFNGTTYDVSYNQTTKAVPEPAALLALGIGGIGLLRRRRRRQAP